MMILPKRISIGAVLILLACACSPEAATPTNAPPAVAVISTAVSTFTPLPTTPTATSTPRLDLTETAESWAATPASTPMPPSTAAPEAIARADTPTVTSTPRLDLTETAQSWTATPSSTWTPTLTNTPSPTATPEGHWGLYAESDFDPEFWDVDWLAVIPVTWRNPSEESARYRLDLEETVAILERCEYGSNRRLVRRQVSAEVSLLDLDSGETLGTTTFHGELPTACQDVVSFGPDELVQYWDGNPPARETFESWLFYVLPDTQPGLVTLTPTPTPTLTPTLVPTDAGMAAFDTIAHNADWEPNLRTFDGVAMMEVPTGCFTMGSLEWEHTQPEHVVCLDSFWIDRTEVTNAQFRSFDGQAEETSSQTGPQQPRNNLTWAEASQFCESRGGRLPTEAEWEFAARGPESWLYPWGDEFVVGSVAGAQDPVGSKPAGASWVGALDLSGSMSEWVNDWSAPYGPEPQVNPSGPESGELRVRRGGSWIDDELMLLSAADRRRATPDARASLIGFRCVRPIED